MLKIALTGGPCAGKTSAKEKIQACFSQVGYTVLFIPETATEMITAGFILEKTISIVDFQTGLMQLQMEKEKVYEKMADRIKSHKILLVCDRGVLDSKAYMPNQEFQKAINGLGYNEAELRNNYDAVFHMTTAAKGVEAAYSLCNNNARTETEKKAILIDDKLIAAWKEHPYHRVIDCSNDIETKLDCLIQEIEEFIKKADRRKNIFYE